MFPLHESALITLVPKRAWNRSDICCKSWNVCNFLNIILDWLALFQMCVQTMYTDEWPSKGIPAAAQWNGLCRANLICGFAQTIQGFEQICCAPELDDEEEQHRGEWRLCELPQVSRPPRRMQRNQEPGGRVPEADPAGGTIWRGGGWVGGFKLFGGARWFFNQQVSFHMDSQPKNQGLKNTLPPNTQACPKRGNNKYNHYISATNTKQLSMRRGQRRWNVQHWQRQSRIC